MPSEATKALFARMQQQLLFTENIERQTKAQKLLDYYDGTQLTHLETVLTTQFAKPDALKLLKAMDNLVRFVADETSRVFDSPPVLACADANGQAVLEDLMENGLLALVWKVGEVYAKLTGVCGLYVWFDPEEEVIKTTIIPASVLFVAQRQDDPTEAEAVVFIRELLDTITGKAIEEYVHWDKESCFLFDTANPGVWRAPSADNPNMENPYGVIPFAWMRDQLPVGRFFTAEDEGLANAQETLNVLLSSLNHLAKYQGFSQPVMIGNMDPKNPIAVDPSLPIRIPPSSREEQPGDFRFATPGSKIPELIALVQDLVERTCTRRGISLMALKDTAGAASGYALKIANSRLDRGREDDLPLARSALFQWWEVVKVVHNRHFPGRPIAATATLEIDFVEPQYQENPKDLLDQQIREVEAGFTDPADIIMARNPDIKDKDEARKVYEANLSYRKTTKKKFGLAEVLNQEPAPASDKNKGV